MFYNIFVLLLDTVATKLKIFFRTSQEANNVYNAQNKQSDKIMPASLYLHAGYKNLRIGTFTRKVNLANLQIMLQLFSPDMLRYCSG